MSSYMEENERRQDIQYLVKAQIGAAIIDQINKEIYSISLSTKMSTRKPSQGVPSDREIADSKVKMATMFDFKVKMEREFNIPHDYAMDEKYGYDSLKQIWTR
jgi:hypothetical protein